MVPSSWIIDTRGTNITTTVEVVSKCNNNTKFLIIIQYYSYFSFDKYYIDKYWFTLLVWLYSGVTPLLDGMLPTIVFQTIKLPITIKYCLDELSYEVYLFGLLVPLFWIIS